MSFVGILLGAFFAPLALILGFFFLYILSPLFGPFVDQCERIHVRIEQFIEDRKLLAGDKQDANR